MPWLHSSLTPSRVARSGWRDLAPKALLNYSAIVACIMLAQPLAVAQHLLPPIREPGAAIIWGIAGYTRWPTGDAAQPFGTPRPLHICLMGEDASTRALRDWAHEPTVRTHHLPTAGASPAAIAAQTRQLGCQLFYQSVPANHSKAAALSLGGGALRELASAGVLTIGRNSEFCSVGGMFCLNPDSSGFVANISAISRSPLRINPQVLQLGKKPKGQ